jgi:hypothetical protein
MGFRNCISRHSAGSIIRPVIRLVAHKHQLEVLCVFARTGVDTGFQWIITTGEGQQFKSDEQSLNGYIGTDPHLRREFLARFKDWRSETGKYQHATNEYLEAYRQATLKGQDFSPPQYALELHRAFVPYVTAKSALTEELKRSHPSGQFCTVRPRDAAAEQFFAYCKSRLWSSDVWEQPGVWMQMADRMFPRG